MIKKDDDCIKYSRPYSDEDLFQILKMKEKEFGRPPYKREIKQRQTICNRFGSWKRALEKAGIDPLGKPKKTIYSNEELISILQDKAKRLGRPPKYHEVTQATTMAFRFGSWNKALKAAGLNLKTFYTIQSLDGWERAKQRGFLCGLEDYIVEDWLPAYKWMMHQMQKRIGFSDFPVWLWTEKPDLNQEGHLEPFKKGILLSVELDESDVLLSDFDAWHCALNDWFCSLTEEEDNKFKKGNLNMSIEESWERIFDIDLFPQSEMWGGEQQLQGVTGRIDCSKFIELEEFIAPE
ncbi:DUF3841 domain-containing protein [Bacillus velezensis]|uniref:homing endonuclease associated repeat-containing protein n=1 Tax=Bacillus velezensis TaxID=492670 RepID=UPI001E48CF2F|nr:DUF3841 domain-containing protein [Bacillus velezensis]MCD7911016.1 DUF3841 domain-containing protein [Bacillus velezensis]